MAYAAGALLYSINPNFTPDQIEYYLKQSANSIIYSISYNSAYIGKLGAGKLDVGAAAELAASNACLPNFTDIVWEFGSTPIINNDYNLYLNTNPVLTFSVNPSLVASGATLEWEFVSGNDVVTRTGNNVSINWGSDFTQLVGSHQRYDVFSLEVYVRQGGNCCYSVYYKEKAFTTSVLAGNAPGPYPPNDCSATFVFDNQILSGNYRAAKIYAGSDYG